MRLDFKIKMLILVSCLNVFLEPALVLVSTANGIKCSSRVIYLTPRLFCALIRNKDGSRTKT